MEVAIGGNGSTPFQREVREWQRVDPNTGALLTGRLEADRWINGPLSAYGKVVDSKNVSQPNGTQHTQRKQFEVLQARTSSGSLQVVRAQTVQTSSSRWSSGTITTQSYDGQRFSSGLPLLTNGHNNHHNDAAITNGHDNIIHHQNHHQIQQKHHLNNISHLNSNLMAAPSLKLSTLMKNSNITNGNNNINGTTNGICNSDSSDGGDSIKSPHSSVSSSMSLVQRHQKHLHKSENETQSIQIVDGKFLQPTMIESRVGGCCNSIEQQSQNQQNLNHMEEFRNGIETSHLQRGRSISTDDLATTDWDPNDDGTEPSEWRRVSKIRRSFQFPKTITPPRESPSRPIDLPENSVSVSRIRQELENGRRLNTAMRNNHVDLVALDNILNGSPETAESLKEIRGKLKKLSDESLYKEDFITQSDLDKLNGTGSNGVQDGYAIEQPVVLQDSQVMKQQPSTFQIRPKPEINHTTNSLENRARYRDTTSAEWHLRRKSYGFEKMAPPPDNSMFCLETSTDSGIGRSGELSNWSSIENQPHSTVITFGDMNNVSKTTVKVVNGHESSSSSKPIVNRRYHHETKDITNRQETVEIKRHSIAVDESKYVRDNLRKVFDTKTSIHLNGLYSKDEINSSSQISVIDENGRRQKRVEFCKTEVHFAAESGRVNIVETDGKPPPTNNFRRRRRSSSNNSSISSAYLEAINSGVPVIHFGDEKKVLFEQETTIEESPKNNVTISIPIINNGNSEKTLTEEDEDPSSDEISLRGILKNKPIKPKPYHLGDNIESNDSLWGVRLKPVSSDFPMPKPKLLENDLHKTVSEQAIIDTENKEHSNIKKSVAERVRIVEERKDGSGYSTKINLNLSNSPYSWEIPELPKSNVMSIELHSPPSTFKKSSSSSTATIVPSRTDGPTAQNRSITSVKTTRSIEDESTGSNSYQTGSIRKIHNKLENCNNKIEKEPLKVVPGGARKLRDHELSYFGIKICNDNNTNNNEIKSNNQQQQQQQQNHKHRINTNNDTNRKLIIHNETNNNKWNTSSDNKPDLLKHSPIVSHKQQSSEQQQQKHTTIIENNGNIKITNHHNIEDDGPIYENLKKPSSYIRKKDLQRDEMNLSEMNQAADQALKAVSKDHSHKEHRHRSPQITSKPLDTIDEKRSTTKSSQQLQQQQHLIKVVKSTKPIQQQTSKHGVESFHRPCCSNRPSSASSNESLSRLSSSSSLRGSRSQDIKEKSDYDSTKSSKKRTSTIKDCTKVQRSNSRDTHRTQHASSSEDLAINPKIDIVRRVKRSKPKEKERTTPTTTKSDDHHRYKSSSIRSNTENDDRYNNRNVKKPEDQRRRSSKLSTESDDHTKMISSTRSSNDTRKSSSRHSSLMKTDKIAPSTTRSKISTTTTDPHKIRIKSSGIITGTTYVFHEPHQQYQNQKIMPPPRKKRRNQSLNNVQHSCSSSFTYFPTTNFQLAMKKREMKNNAKRQRRRKSLGLCICS